MWRFVYTLLFTLALTGVVGPSSAFAAPERPDAGVEAMAAMPDCAEMTATKPADHPSCPSDESGLECIGRAGCTAMAGLLPPDVDVWLRSPSPPRARRAFNSDDTLMGERLVPIGVPPKAQA